MSKDAKSGVRKLYRSGKEKILGGVCGGIAEHFNIDPTIVRVLWVIGSLFWGAAIFIYLVLWLIIPMNPSHKKN